MTIFHLDKKKSDNRKSFCTARSLLGILRLSQAMARIHFRDHVTKEDVEEAQRLLMVSNTMETDDVRGQTQDYISAIYDILTDHAKSRQQREIDRKNVLPKLSRAGFNEDQLEECLDAYEDQAVWTVSTDRQRIRFSIGGN